MEIAGKQKRIYVTKSTSHAEVDRKIQAAFGISQYKFLECTHGGNRLKYSSNQQMDGSDAIMRRGCLYLCNEVSTQ